jgi:ribosome-binding factor A
MSFRDEKIENRIKELAAIFIEKESGLTSMITVTRIELDDRRRNATIFITAIPEEREAAAFGFIRRNLREMRKFIQDNLKIRPIPYLKVEIDKGEKNRRRIDELLKNQ